MWDSVFSFNLVSYSPSNLWASAFTFDLIAASKIVAAFCLNSSDKSESPINYLGYIDLQKELYKYDLLLSLSDHEGFSRVLLEAMYVGLYVISNKNNGTSYIDNFENTILLNSKNNKSLGDTLLINFYPRKNL